MFCLLAIVSDAVTTCPPLSVPFRLATNALYSECPSLVYALIWLNAGLGRPPPAALPFQFRSRMMTSSFPLT